MKPVVAGLKELKQADDKGGLTGFLELESLAGFANEVVSDAKSLFQKIVQRFYPVIDIDFPDSLYETKDEGEMCMPGQDPG